MHGRGHGPGAGAGKRKHGLFRAEKMFQADLDIIQQGGEGRRAVVDHVGGKGQPHPLGQRSGAGRQQTDFVQHGETRAEVLRPSRETWSVNVFR